MCRMVILCDNTFLYCYLLFLNVVMMSSNNSSSTWTTMHFPLIRRMWYSSVMTWNMSIMYPVVRYHQFRQRNVVVMVYYYYYYYGPMLYVLTHRYCNLDTHDKVCTYIPTLLIISSWPPVSLDGGCSIHSCQIDPLVV